MISSKIWSMHSTCDELSTTSLIRIADTSPVLLTSLHPFFMMAPPYGPCAPLTFLLRKVCARRRGGVEEERVMRCRV